MDKQETTRRLHAIIDGGCWHDLVRVRESHNHPENGNMVYTVLCSCGEVSYNWSPTRKDLLHTCNPTYSNPAVIAEKMRERGLWTEFARDIYNHHINLKGDHWYDLIEDLTTPDLLAQAIVSWWETTHKWTDNNHYEVTG